MTLGELRVSVVCALTGRLLVSGSVSAWLQRQEVTCVSMWTGFVRQSATTGPRASVTHAAHPMDTWQEWTHGRNWEGVGALTTLVCCSSVKHSGYQDSTFLASLHCGSLRTEREGS